MDFSFKKEKNNLNSKNMVNIGISVFPPKIIVAHNQKLNITFDCWFENNDTLVKVVIGQNWHWDPGRVQRASILVLGHGIEAPQSKLPVVCSPLPCRWQYSTVQCSQLHSSAVQCNKGNGSAVQCIAVHCATAVQHTTVQWPFLAVPNRDTQAVYRQHCVMYRTALYCTVPFCTVLYS